VFTSNRGEDTVGIFTTEAENEVVKVGVGSRPNGLAFDPERHILLSANVGDPSGPDSHTVTLVDVRRHTTLANIPVPGRTRWTVFDPAQSLFFVNIADPAQIVVIDPQRLQAVAGHLEVPNRGPHGLDIDPARRRLYCACDGGKLVSLDSTSGACKACST